MDLEHERRLAETESREKANTRRIEKLEERQDNLDKLVGAFEALSTREQRVEADVKEIKKDVKLLSEKPGKRWEALVGQVISILVAAVVGFLLARLGMG